MLEPFRFWGSLTGVIKNGMRQSLAIPRQSSWTRTLRRRTLGWGYCLVNLKKYEDAIPPLRTAERLMPANPEVHHSLGTALERCTDARMEAQKEFAIH